MKKIFLKAKHWQLFAMVSIFPLIFATVTATDLFIKNIDPSWINLLFTFSTTFFVIVITSWIWSIVIGFRSIGDTHLKFEINKFILNIILLFPIIINLALLLNYILETTISFNLMLLEPLSLLSIIFSSYLAAKTIKSAEKNEDVKLVDFIDVIVLVFMFPIGIWIIQPRVNKLFMRTGN